MASSTTKKVVVRRFDREPVTGFVNPQTYLTERGVEVLTLGGSVLMVPYAELKAVCFVKEFEPPDATPERRQYMHRPKTAGLWVRLSLRDRDDWDGLLVNDLLQWDSHGFVLIPPDLTANTQKLFIPRDAVTAAQVLAVVGSPLAPKKKAKKKPAGQMDMFGDG